jgi:hypothetical protein
VLLLLVVLAGLLNSVMLTPSSPAVVTPGSTAQLGELSGLLSGVPPSPLAHPSGGLRSGSPISAAASAIAAASLLSGPPPSKACLLLVV